MHGKKQRQDIRLRLDSVTKGVVFLRSRSLPAAACTLVELSESGCSCLAPVGSLDESSASRLKAAEPGRQISIDLSAPPHLPGVHLDAEIKRSESDGNGKLELGLQFINVESYERDLITQALDKFAAEKLAPVVNETPLEDLPPVQHNSEPVAAAETQLATAPAENTAEASPVEAANPARISKVWLAPTYTSSPDDPYRGKRLGEILKDLGKISDERLNEAHAATRSANEKLGRYLLRSGWISPIDLCGALALQSGLPMVDLSEFEVQPSLAGLFSYLTLLRYEFIPFHESNEILSVAATNPIPPSMLTDLEQRCGKRIRVFLCEDDAVMKALHALRPAKERRLRRQKRFHLSVPMTLRFFNRQQSLQAAMAFTGQMIDVSETGFMVSMHEDLRKRGTCVQLTFELTPQKVEAICSIRYIREQAADGDTPAHFRVGLQVMDMTQDFRTQLKEICIRASMWNLADSKYKK